MNLVARNLKLQLTVVLVQFLVSFIGGAEWVDFSSGAMGLWFNLMTMFCWLNPKQMKLCCFNVQFNRRFYPLMFGIIITLYNWQIRADIVVGVVLGLLQATVFSRIGDWLQMKHY